MSIENSSAENTSATSASRMAAFAKNIDEIKHALDILYIPKNASGRNKFREKWPEFAEYVFGTDLIAFDNEGVTDRDQRDGLEDKACQRRLLLKNTITEMQEKSVEDGVLQFEYVGQVIDNFGPKLSVLLYAPDVVRRVRPEVFTKAGLVAEAVVGSDELVDDSVIEDTSVPVPPNVTMSPSEDTSIDQSSVSEKNMDDSDVADHKLSEDEVALLSNKPDDDFDISSYDHVSPIVTDEVADVEGAEEGEIAGEDQDVEVASTVESVDEESSDDLNPAPDMSVQAATSALTPDSVEAPEQEAEGNPAPPISAIQDESPVSSDVETVQDNPAPPIHEPNPAPAIEPVQESNPAPPVIPEAEPNMSEPINSDELLADIPEPIIRPRPKEGDDQNFSVPSSNHVPSMDDMPDITKEVVPEKGAEEETQSVAPASHDAPDVEPVQSNPAPPIHEPNPAPAIEPVQEGNPAPPISETVVPQGNPAPPIDQAEENEGGPVASPLNLHKVKKAEISEPSIGQGNVISDETDLTS